ncbi:hypothetical protein Dimus_009450 [Dionaea muscipula]
MMNSRSIAEESFEESDGVVEDDKLREKPTGRAMVSHLMMTRPDEPVQRVSRLCVSILQFNLHKQHAVVKENGCRQENTAVDLQSLNWKLDSSDAIRTHKSHRYMMV